MGCLLCLVVFTANILGSFNDPFEFEGNYGTTINPIRTYVFEQIVSKEALATNLTDREIIQTFGNTHLPAQDIQNYREALTKEGLQEDIKHGPILSELLAPSLIKQLTEKQQQLEGNGFSSAQLHQFVSFINRYGDQKAFYFFRHTPGDLLSLDKILRDQASREGKDFDLPILSSTAPLKGSNTLELQEALMSRLFTKETLSVAKPEDKLNEAIESLDPNFLEQYLGAGANKDDLKIFASPAGQTFFYFLYQSLNLHLTTQNAGMIPQINLAKQVFADTLGNALVRAVEFRDKLIVSDAKILFTQESDAIIPQKLSESGLFHSVATQNSTDGTLVFLRADVFEPDYQVIPIEGYDGYERGRLNVILATKNDTKEKFLLASGHGNSTRAEDGRLQIAKVMDKFHELATLPENAGLQLIIGIDANTKSDEDVKLLREQLESLGLVATSVGPTTIKKRMVTAQHSKAGRFAIDEEDYLITLKREVGGHYHMNEPTVGFQLRRPDPTVALPNIDNPSDHYPVGAMFLREP